MSAPVGTRRLRQHAKANKSYLLFWLILYICYN